MFSILGMHVANDFLDADQETWLRHWVEQQPEQEWQAVVFRGVEARRRMMCFGWNYVTTGRRLEPAPPLPEAMERLRNAACRRFRVPDPQGLEQLIVTRYPPGSGIGVHVDAPVFGEHVVGVSLGGAGRLHFTRQRHTAVTVGLPSGSAYVMSGEARWRWFHQLRPVKETRWSFTFRRLREAL